jgi:hypothetical protein
MFCPDGYVSFSELIRRIPDQVTERVRATYENEFARWVDIPEIGWNYFFRLGSQDDMIEAVFLRSLIGHTFLAGPQGQILRLDTYPLISSGTANDGGKLEQLIWAECELPAHFQLLYDLMFVDPYEPIEGYSRFLDEAPKEPKTDPDARRRSAFLRRMYWRFGHLTVPWWYERKSYRVTLEGFDYFSGSQFCDGIESYPEMSSLKPFIGWALCVKDDIIKDVWPKQLDYYLGWTAEFMTPKSSGSQKLLGRPGKIQPAAEAYSLHYPNGHAGLTWKELAAALATKADIDASEDTLRKAVRLARRLKSQ